MSLPLCCGYEISVPATKTFTQPDAYLPLSCHRLAGGDTSELYRVPELMEQTMRNGRRASRKIAAEINSWNDLYCLGYGAPTRWRSKAH